MKPCTYQPKPKNKRNPPRENFLCFRKRKPRKLFLCFGKQRPRKKFLIFQETEAPKKPLIFKEVTFRARKMKKPTLKKLLIFQEIELSSLGFKINFLYFRRNFQSLKIKQEAIL